MDEYIKREDALKAIDHIRCVMHEPKERYVIGESIMRVLDATWDACDRHINRIPAEDVVPKSEVEKQKLEIWRLEGEIEQLKHICNSYALQYGTVTDQQKVIDEAKAEVAREIFGEITDSIMFAYKNDIIKYTSLLYFTSKLTELKKKYTEGTPE